MNFGLILGGVLTACAFPLQPDPTRGGIALWPLAWFSLVPLLIRLLTTPTARSAAGAGLIFGSAWMFVACVWVFRVFDAFGFVLIWLPIIWIVLFSVLAHWVRRAGLSPWWSWPVLWIAIELIRSEWSPVRLDWFSPNLDPLRFSWLVLGHSRLSEPLMAQTADVWGGYGLSLAPFLCNLLIARVIVERRVPAAAIAAVAGLTIGEIGYGLMSLNRGAERPAFAVGVVQSERESLPTLLELSEALLRDAPQVRIIVWPEESFAEQLGDLSVIQAFASQQNVVVVAGVEHPLGDGRHENRAYVLQPDRSVGIYRKRERVPFVERHARSDELPTFELMIENQPIRAGVLICYDADFPTTARELARAGAELLLMPSLDEGGWGGTQHVQHALLPRLRAIENRRPIVQAATSGVSQILDDRGRVLAEIPFRLNRRPARATLFREGTAQASVTPNAALSWYTLWGHWFGPGIAVGAAGALLLALWRRGAKPNPIAVVGSFGVTTIILTTRGGMP